MRSACGGPGVFPLLVAGVAAIQYLCVPETDHIWMIGASAVMLGLLEVLTSGTYAASRVVIVVLVAWSGWFGAAGRASAEVGALVAFWPVIVAISILATGRFTARSISFLGPVLAAAIGAAIVARTGALSADVAPAFRSVAIWVPVSILAIAMILTITHLTITHLTTTRQHTSAAAFHHGTSDSLDGS